MTTIRTIERFQTELASQGLAAALRWLNAGVPHRYTTVYRLIDSTFYNVLLHDQLDQLPPDGLAVVEMRQSFCQVVVREGSLQASDSRLERRLDGSPYQGVVIAYHAVPVTDVAGQLVGTLSHFDMVEQPLSADEFTLLEQAGRALHPFLPAFTPAVER